MSLSIPSSKNLAQVSLLLNFFAWVTETVWHWSGVSFSFTLVGCRTYGVKHIPPHPFILFILIMNLLNSGAVIVVLEMALSLISMVANLVICISIRYSKQFKIIPSIKGTLLWFCASFKAVCCLYIPPYSRGGTYQLFCFKYIIFKLKYLSL
jgi:hypothetical protein